LYESVKPKLVALSTFICYVAGLNLIYGLNSTNLPLILINSSPLRDLTIEPPDKQTSLKETHFMADEQNQPTELKIDRSNLFKEETYTDLKVGIVKCMTPVKADGTVDKTRKSVFVGQTSLMTPNGPLPIQGIIQAKELQQAIKKFPETMQASMERLAEEARKYQEQENANIEKPDSRIIVPGR
jgi:hypothetical protein